MSIHWDWQPLAMQLLTHITGWREKFLVLWFLFLNLWRCYYNCHQFYLFGIDIITLVIVHVIYDIALFILISKTKIENQYEIFIDILFRYKHVLTICQQSILSTPFTEKLTFVCNHKKSLHIIADQNLKKMQRGGIPYVPFYVKICYYEIFKQMIKTRLRRYWYSIHIIR